MQIDQELEAKNLNMFKGNNEQKSRENLYTTHTHKHIEKPEVTFATSHVRTDEVTITSRLQRIFTMS